MRGLGATPKNFAPRFLRNINSANSNPSYKFRPSPAIALRSYSKKEMLPYEPVVKH